MTHTPTTTTERPTPPLVRVHEQRLIAGVASGAARRLDLPLWLVRVGFVVLAFFGGFGLALYLAGWLLIRDERESEAIATRLVRRIDGAAGWIGVSLVGLAVLIFLDATGILGGDLAAALVLGVIGVLLYRGELGGGGKPTPPVSPDSDETATPESDADTEPEDVDSDGADVEAPDTTTQENEPMTSPPSTTIPTDRSRTVAVAAPPPRPEAPPRDRSRLGPLTLAIGLIVLGVIGIFDVALSNFDPTARHYWSLALTITGVGLIVGAWFGRARGLIALGVILVPIVFASPLAELNVTGSVGERRIAPGSTSEISTAYELGIGSMRIDLGGVDFEGDTVETTVEVGVGELVVIVPDDITLEVTGEAGIGEVDLLGRSSDGVGVDRFETRAGTNGRLILDSSVGIGAIEVRTVPAPADSLDEATGALTTLPIVQVDSLLGKEAA